MAFVGAGASALLSFKLINFRLKPMIFETLYFDESVIIKSSKINYITIVPNAQLLLSLDGVFCNKKNADDILIP
ncbi:hypothetical protein GCM10007855_12150 [Aliivibrio sifiae]|uniref:Uncharacterized protein n=1 Tax=Aliivibrio sifiae TaxID=566293 RepID=A0ABQ6AHR6_9GAMM|nr:hypothetical protein GCM10007855_12150 [Aliivibrio sifiae]